MTALFAFSSVYAQEAVDSMRIYYRTGYRYVEPEYKNNRAELERFIKAIKDVFNSGRLDKVTVKSYASPDGSNEANLLLSERRVDSLKAYILRNSGIPESSVIGKSGGIAWDLLRQIVAASDIQWKEDILNVLDNTPMWIYDESGKLIGGKKKELMDLDGGKAYKYLYDNIFPTLRSSLAATLYEKPASAVTAPVEEEAPAPQPEPQPQTEPEPQPQAEPEPAPEPAPVTEPTSMADPSAKAFRPLLAVKTNLLYWGTIMPDFHSYTFVPNLELEYFFKEMWSVSGTVNWAKWGYGSDNFFGISSYSLEPRWWIWGDGRYRWIYLGLYGQVGDYDTQNERSTLTGDTGKHWSTGLSVGAAIPFSKRWGLEIGIRGGYRHSSVRGYTYEAPDYFLDYEHTGNHWGVTGIKASIYYRFGKGSK